MARCQNPGEDRVGGTGGQKRLLNDGGATPTRSALFQPDCVAMKHEESGGFAKGMIDGTARAGSFLASSMSHAVASRAALRSRAIVRSLLPLAHAAGAP